MRKYFFYVQSNAMLNEEEEEEEKWVGKLYSKWIFIHCDLHTVADGEKQKNGKN